MLIVLIKTGKINKISNKKNINDDSIISAKKLDFQSKFVTDSLYANSSLVYIIKVYYIERNRFKVSYGKNYKKMDSNFNVINNILNTK